uniref:HEAT repeat-containing protein 1 n=1 Tax=Elaeophora elaphi TaxID=1147741 RepID=A0A158Q7F4_9BILA
MTSLEKQLNNLRTAVSGQLGVERPHVSLLFDKRDAGSLYVENALQIGRAGLTELRKVDSKIALEEEDLFDDTAVNVQRALLTKEENTALNEKLERLIIQLSAYLHHLSAKRILEWLIFQFHVQSFNAETLFIAFLPYHNSNIFGRLISILDLKGLEYGWIKEYANLEASIPMTKLVVICASRNHSLLTLIYNHIERVRELFSANFVETKLPHLFTFFASISVHLLAKCDVTDALVSKMLPSLARGLMSDLVSLRLACLTVISQLCINVKLISNKLFPIIKLILLKMDSYTMKESIDTLVVICQRQEISSFPLKLKIALKIARKDECLHISKYIKSLFSVTDMRQFFGSFARTFIPMLSKCDTEEKLMELCNFCVNCLDLTVLNDRISETILGLVMELLSETSDAEKMPNIFYKHIRVLIFRFPNAFASIGLEWKVRDESVYNMLLKACKFEQYEIETIEVVITEKKKRRRRHSSTKNSIEEGESQPSSPVSKPALKRKRPEEIKQEQLNSVREPLKITFKGDPLEKLIDTIKAEDWALAEAGLEKLTAPYYLKNRVASEFEMFFSKMVAIALAEGALLKTAIKNALSQLPVNADFALSLLKPYTELKSAKRSRDMCHWSCFKNEDTGKFETRRLFVLELLLVNRTLQASAKLFHQLYEILKEVLLKADEESQYLEQLIINFIVSLVKNPRGYKVLADDLQLDTVVDIVRHTQNHRILRDCLQLLTCAVTVSPKKVLAHLMSVYTFMGDGVLKKDNDLTLSVIEETLNVLFSTVMREKDQSLDEQLVITSRLFAASITDIPAHRRDRILRAVARSAGTQYLWAVIAILFERYCLNWPKKTEGRTSTELYEEMSTIMVSEYDAVEQLSCTANMIKYIVKLGGDFSAYESPTTIVGQKEKFLSKIFDRTKHSVQKLRHYRFAILGWIARLLESDEFKIKISKIYYSYSSKGSDWKFLIFQFRLVAVDDNSYHRLFEIAKILLFCSVELDDFVTTEVSDAEKRNVQENSGRQIGNNCKYWIAVSSRADLVIEKFQNLLPSNVCGHIVVDVLEQTATMPKLRDRALQFLNTKLLQDVSYIRMVKVDHLNSLIRKFNSWLKPVEKEFDVQLCQKAAHTLKLVARSITPSTGFMLLFETLELTVELLNNRSMYDETVTGSLLLLAGELMRFQRVKNSILYSNALTAICTQILSAVLETQAVIRTSSNQQTDLSKDGVLGGRRRRFQYSMNGRYVTSSDALLICSLVCLQRILENFAGFIFKHLSSILIIISRLCCICDYIPSANCSAQQMQPTNKFSAAQQRISCICRSLSKMELRIVLDAFDEACNTLIIEPAIALPFSSLNALTETYFSKHFSNVLAAVGILFKMLSSINDIKNREILLKFVVRLCDVYLHGLDMRSSNAKLGNNDTIDSAELMIIDSFLEVIDNLSENEFRTVTKAIHMRLQDATSPKAKTEVRYRSITIFRFLNRFYESYKNISLPHFGRFFGILPDIFSRCNSHVTDCQSLIFYDGEDSVNTATISVGCLLTVVIDFVKNCARHPAFFTLERTKIVLDFLVDELENIDVPGHELRCVPHLAECFYNIIDCQNEILMDTINKIMLKTRSQSPKVRYRTLLVLEWLFEHMGDAVAPTLPSVLPFLSELLEGTVFSLEKDDNRKVEMQCDVVIGVLRKNFGEEITEGYA